MTYLLKVTIKAHVWKMEGEGEIPAWHSTISSIVVRSVLKRTCSHFPPRIIHPWVGLLSCNALSDKCFLGLNDFFLIIKALAVTICHLEEEGEEKSLEKYEIRCTSLYQMTTFTKYLLYRYVTGSVCSHQPRRTSFLDFVFSKMMLMKSLDHH